jgi:hypothetical protein
VLSHLSHVLGFIDPVPPQNLIVNTSTPLFFHSASLPLPILTLVLPAGQTRRPFLSDPLHLHCRLLCWPLQSFLIFHKVFIWIYH